MFRACELKDQTYKKTRTLHFSDFRKGGETPKRLVLWIPVTNIWRGVAEQLLKGVSRFKLPRVAVHGGCRSYTVAYRALGGGHMEEGQEKY